MWATGFHTDDLAYSNGLVHRTVGVVQRAQENTLLSMMALNLGSSFFTFWSAGRCPFIQGTLDSLKCLSHSRLVGGGGAEHEVKS